MTREKALSIIKERMNYDKTTGEWDGLSPFGLIHILVELGILEVEEELEPNQLFFSAMGEVPMNQRDVGKILAVINALGLKLTEK